MVRGARSLSSTSAARQPATWRLVNRKRSGRPLPSVSAWSLLLRPPRLIPIAWMSAPFSAACRAVSFYMRSVDQDFGRRSARCRHTPFGKVRINTQLGRAVRTGTRNRAADRRQRLCAYAFPGGKNGSGSGVVILPRISLRPATNPPTSSSSTRCSSRVRTSSMASAASFSSKPSPVSTA